MKRFLLQTILFIICTNLLAQDKAKGPVEEIPFVIWSGNNTRMTVQKLAEYCAPVFWFSPDEPELNNKSGKQIKIPTHFPFENKTDSPVVYYQFDDIIKRDIVGVKPLVMNYSNVGNSIIDISQVVAFTINYSHYYLNEAGLGGHRDDTEQGILKFTVKRVRKNDTTVIYRIILQEVNAKAHALNWYDNKWYLDTNSIETVLPVHLLVEEGKHASCTDMNADGVYTPGYDVNVRTNDAWGVRDVIRTGNLFSSEYQSYFSKTRYDEYKVFPPLPDDSPLLRYYIDSAGVYAPANAVYSLRPFPNPVNVRNGHLRKDMEGYYVKKPYDVVKEDLLSEWLEDDLIIKSIGIAARYDNRSLGVSVSFPFFIVKNLETPLIGGWIVNKMNFTDTNLRDISYTALITPSASRFLDPYLAIGVESDMEYDNAQLKRVRNAEAIVETGIKIRVNVRYSFLKFLSFLSDFWGFRAGVKNKGFPDITRLSYIFEFGAGVW